MDSRGSRARNRIDHTHGAGRRPARVRISSALALSTALLLALSLASWAFWLEPAALHNENHSLLLPDWPESCDGLRVAVLADLHVGSPHNGLDKLERVVELARAASPDLVLLAGDYVIHGVAGGGFIPPEPAARVLAKLQAPLGVHAVLGNHDYWLDGDRVASALESAGISVHDDHSIPLRWGSCDFWLTGIDDLWEGDPDIDAALSTVPEASPILAFTHNPDAFPDVPERVSLTIAGHTHGGQVSLPGIGRPIVPSRFGERFAAGHIVEGGRHLFVSTGLGTSILPIRFRVPPEISVLELRSPQAARRLALEPEATRAQDG